MCTIAASVRLNFLKKYYICVSLQVCNCRCTYTAALMCAWGQLVQVSSSLLLFGSQGWNSGQQALESTLYHWGILQAREFTFIDLPRQYWSATAFRTYTVVEWRFTGWVPGLLWVGSCVCSTWILPSRLFSGRKTRCVACQMPEDLALKLCILQIQLWKFPPLSHENTLSYWA